MNDKEHEELQLLRESRSSDRAEIAALRSALASRDRHLEALDVECINLRAEIERLRHGGGSEPS